MSKREVNTPRDGVRSHYIAIDQLYITEENVYLTFAHCYYQKLLLTPSVGIFYHNVLMSLCYNGGCRKLRALYPLLIIQVVAMTGVLHRYQKTHLSWAICCLTFSRAILSSSFSLLRSSASCINSCSSCSFFFFSTDCPCF